MNNKTSQIVIREMRVDDIDDAINLWSNNSNGLGLDDADTPEKLFAYIQHNEHMSFVAEVQPIFGDAMPQIIGTILAGTDMRRTYINHLFVAEEYRHLHIGSMNPTKSTRGMNHNIEEISIPTARKQRRKNRYQR